jgi:hypothetical protein
MDGTFANEGVAPGAAAVPRGLFADWFIII